MMWFMFYANEYLTKSSKQIGSQGKKINLLTVNTAWVIKSCPCLDVI